MKLDLTDGDMAEIQVQGAKLLIHTDYRGFPQMVKDAALGKGLRALLVEAAA